jgi:DNA-binding HxlR family transcriptional regulator
MRLRHIDLPHDCVMLADVPSRVGDKWTVLVVYALGLRSMRFNELKRMVEGISQRMLTLTLRALERDGMVTRSVTPSNPPRVDYALTDLGRTLLVPVMALGDWGARQPAGHPRRARTLRPPGPAQPLSRFSPVR